MSRADPKYWDRMHAIVAGERRTVGVCWNESWDRTAVRFGATGWNQRDFHYLPTGPWEDWVELAHKILAEDERRKALNASQAHVKHKTEGDCEPPPAPPTEEGGGL